MRASPFSHVTLFLVNRNSTPLTLAPTTSALRACMRARSSFTPDTTTPCAAKSWPAWAKFSLDCRSEFHALDVGPHHFGFARLHARQIQLHPRHHHPVRGQIVAGLGKILT